MDPLPPQRLLLRNVLALAMVVVLSSCGSTLAVRGQVTAGQGAGNGGPGDATAPGGGTAGSTGPGPAGTGTLTVPTFSGAGAGAGGTTGSAAIGTGGGQPLGGSTGSRSASGGLPASGGQPASGRGFDAGHVYLGFPTNNDASGAAHSLGLAGLDFGDQIAQVNALVADVNRKGGLFGRTVVAVVHDLKTSDLQTNAPSQAQATCDAFTQDRQVAAVVNIVAAIDVDTFFACLAKHQTPLFSGGFVPTDGTLLRAYSPYLYKLPAPDFDTFGPVWLSRLAARGYFTGWDTNNGSAGTSPVKVGLLYASAQPSRRIFAKLKAQLKARGISVGSDVAYDVSNLSNESSAMSNAVLTFRSNGVTHVLADASDVQLFMTAADSQHYKPRYGMNSYLAPILQAGNTPAQLIGSIGVGWIPAADVATADRPGPDPSETDCRRLMRQGGQPMSSYGVELIAYSLCDGVHLLLSAANATGHLDAGSLTSGFARTGPSFPPALTFRSGITSQIHSLPGVGRDFAWQTSCSCYRYLDKIDRTW